MTRRSLLAAVVCALVLVGAVGARARATVIPQATASYLLGPRMIRAELAMRAPTGAAVSDDWRIDRGRLTKRYAAGALTLNEPFGPTSIKVASTAHVILNGKQVTVRALRAGMLVAVPRDNNQAAVTVYAGTKTAPKLPRATINTLFSGRMVRAEIGLKSADGVTHDFLLDHGRIRQLTGTSLTLREGDGSVVTVAATPLARVKLNGKDAVYTQLRKGMMAVTMHDGDTKPADQIWATGRTG